MTRLMTWLVPAAGPAEELLLTTITRLADEYDAPRFSPHVTLTPTFDSPLEQAAQTLTALVAGLPAVEVTFAAAGHEQAYFRALYLLPEPSAELTAIHEAAQRAWDMGPWAFQPHLSLLYSEIPEAGKPLIIDSIGIPLPLTVRFDAVELWARGDPEVRGWYRVARAPFSRLPGEA